MSADAYLAARSVRRSSGCLEWIGPKSNGNYGLAHVGGVKTTAHRFAYEIVHGPIPPGLEIDHLCRNTLCILPDHLEAVTHLENVRRSSIAGKTQCKNGHPFDQANTYIKANGCKSCRVCNAERQRVLRAANPERYRGYELTRKRRKK